MFMILLAMFIIVPLAELIVIVEIGSRIGYLYTILALVVISFAGAALAKRQGYAAVARIQEDFRQGRMPGDSLIDGALILAGTLLLLTPGYITDIVGLLLLLPPVRALVRTFARRRLQRAIERRTLRVWTPGDRGGPGSGYSPGSGYGSGGPPHGPPPTEPEQRRKELED
jgi:UPF0716 protein FxsA